MLGKILKQLIGPNSPLPIEILLQAKPKDAPTNAIPSLIEVLSTVVSRNPNAIRQLADYCGVQKRVGSLTKEQHTGRLVDDWKAALDASSHKFDTVDVSISLSACMAVKDNDEMVRVSARFKSDN